MLQRCYLLLANSLGLPTWIWIFSTFWGYEDQDGKLYLFSCGVSYIGTFCTVVYNNWEKLYSFLKRYILDRGRAWYQGMFTSTSSTHESENELSKVLILDVSGGGMDIV